MGYRTKRIVKKNDCSKGLNNDKDKLDFIDRLFISYLDTETVDYAYLLSGKWGCGKTYYCNSILPSYLSSFCELEGKKYVVNISLFGRKTLGNVFTEIIVKVIGMEKGYSLLDRISIDEAASVVGETTNKSWVSSVFSYFGKVINKNLPEIIQGIDSLDLKKQVLIVFDDLERCDENDLKHLIGRIQTDFIDNGYHVLFVANEEEIKWEDFPYWKEKFIRTTICFSKPIGGIITHLLDSRTDTPIKRLFVKDRPRFLSLISVLYTINNIRTWMFAFDVYDRVIIDAHVSESNPYLHNLFLIIVLSCYYSNIDKSLFTNEINFTIENDKTPTIERVIRADFHIPCDELPGLHGREWTLSKRLHSNSFVYVKMKSIIGLIQQGFLDTHLFKEEFETSFPWGNKYEIAYSRIMDFLCLEEDEFKNVVKTIMEGVDRKEYKLFQYINIAVSMDLLDNNGYFAIERCENYQEKIINAVDATDIHSLGTDPSYLKRRYNESPDFIKPSIERIINRIKLNDSRKEDFFVLFQKLKNDEEYDSQSPVFEIFFEYVDKYRLAKEIISFSGKALKAIDSFLFSFTNYDNCGRLHSDRIPSMKYIHSEINAYLTSSDNKSKHFHDLQYFNGLLLSAINKLESSAS